MSFYNMAFGKSSAAPALLKMLGLGEDDFYRFRDCYLTEDGKIAVYTRGGGGNRECWNDDDCENGQHSVGCVITIQEENRKHPCYLSDSDDDFDNTYATFYFKVPDAEQIRGIAPEMERDEAWQKLIAALKVAP